MVGFTIFSLLFLSLLFVLLNFLVRINFLKFDWFYNDTRLLHDLHKKIVKEPSICFYQDEVFAVLIHNEIVLTSGRLRAPITDVGLKSGPIGMRILCSNTSFSV